MLFKKNLVHFIRLKIDEGSIRFRVGILRQFRVASFLLNYT